MASKWGSLHSKYVASIWSRVNTRQYVAGWNHVKDQSDELHREWEPIFFVPVYVPENAFLKPLETIFGVTFADRYSHFRQACRLYIFVKRFRFSTREIEISFGLSICVISVRNKWFLYLLICHVSSFRNLYRFIILQFHKIYNFFFFLLKEFES